MSDTTFDHVDNSLLTEDDLTAVSSATIDVKAKYYQLGIALGLKPGAVDGIKKENIGDVDQAFQKVLLTWLRQEYDVKRHGPPSWRKLLECIGIPSGGANLALAKRLAPLHPVNAESTKHEAQRSDNDGSSPKAICSTESTSTNLGVEGLSKLLLGEFGADYEDDIDKLRVAKVDGEYFLSILKGEVSLKVEVTPGFEFHLERRKQTLISMIVAVHDTGSSSATKSPILPSSIMSWCTTEFEEIIEVNSDGERLPACASPRCVWRGRKELLVKFLDPIPKHWTYRGRDLNFGNILSWANEWSLRGGGVIPSFTEYASEAQSDIRIRFNSQTNESELGNRAQNIRNGEPTMWLNLGLGTDTYKKHLVIHEFGHALGLYHEHQRSDFWKHIGPYINTSVMKSDLRMSDAEFNKRYGKDNKTKSASVTKYDPDSVMHYWFNKDWLTNGYDNEGKVIQDFKQKKLSEEAHDALLGVHKRHDSLADEPSALDIEWLIKLYEDANTATCTILGPPPTKKLRVSTVTDDYDYPESATVKDIPVLNHHLSLIKWKERENGEVQQLRIYDSAKPKWDRIARSLGFEEGHIESIGDDCRNNYARVCKVFQEWSENAGNLPNNKKYPMTWDGLIALLSDSDLQVLSDKLKKALAAPFSNVNGDEL